MEIPTKAPEGISLFTYIVVFILSGWGGAVHFIRKLRDNKGIVFPIAELIGDLIISTFVGVVVFILCKASGRSDLLSVGLSCVASNMGSKALYMIEVWTTKRVERFMPESDADHNPSQIGNKE